MLIHGKVITNLDAYKNETWPPVFVEVPKIEKSYIRSKSGVVLKVVRITHCVFTVGNDPYIEIEVGN